MERSMTQKLVAEFIGTLTLVFIGGGAVIAGNIYPTLAVGIVGIALAHGLAIATMVSALGHVSGGHFNPAITIGAWVTQKIESRNAITYIVAQLAGGAAGAFLLRAALPEAAWRGPAGVAALGLPQPNAQLISTGSAVLIEAILTFFLVWVVFATAIDPEGAFGKIAGLTIGLTITMGILMGGGHTGAAMNPARWFGPAIADLNFGSWWVYVFGPAAGGVMAAVLYDYVILGPRVGEGSAAAGEIAHGWGAHGDDPDAQRGADEGLDFGQRH